MKLKKITFVCITLICFYVGSYVVVRTNRSVNDAKEGCPERGCNYVYLPSGLVYTFYRPMIFLDEHTMDDTEFIRMSE